MAETHKLTWLGIPAVLASMVLTAGCLFQKPPKPIAYTPPPPRPKFQPPPAPILPEGPDLEVAAILPMQLPVYIPAIPEPPRPAKPKPPVATGPKPPLTPPEPAAPAPRLGQIFTAEEIRDYNRDLDESLDRVRKALGTLGTKHLGTQDGLTVERIRTFQKQAEQARQEDLVTAVSLARRADLLAQDLLKRLP